MKTVLIGCGNLERGEDAAGLLVVRGLRDKLPPQVDVREIHSDGLSLIEAWAGCERAIVVDAVVSGAPSGTLHRFDGRLLPGPERLQACSSHSLGLREIIRLAEQLGALPPQLIVFGIEARRFQMGDAVSLEVRTGIDQAIQAVLREISGGAAAARA